MNKIVILLTYIRITIKLLFLDKLFRLKSEKIFGFKINFFNYRIFHLLFRIIFLHNEYFFIANKKNPLILDCGANIGLATLFFKWLYPGSEIHALEPDPQTFKILKKNINQNHLNDVHLYDAAICDRNGKIEFYIEKEKPGALRMSIKFQRMPKDKILVHSVKLSSIIRNYLGNREIDFLKMDIEGAEEICFSDLSSHRQFKKVKEMSIEYHHKIGNEKAKLAQFLEILQNNEFEYRIEASCLPMYSQGKFQNINIYCSKE